MAAEMTSLDVLADDVPDRKREMNANTLGRSGAFRPVVIKGAVNALLQHTKQYAIHHANVAKLLSARVPAQLPAQPAAQGAAAWI